MESPSNTPANPTTTDGASTVASTAAPTSAFVWILLAYIAALLAATLILWQDQLVISESILVRALVADVVATLVIFGFSTAFSNASFYDAYWSVAPPFLLVYFLYAQRLGTDHLWDLRVILLAALVFAWAIRLTHNWARGWQGLTHADWRYVDLAEKTAPLWWLVNLLGIHLMPTVLVFLGCIALQQSLVPNAAPINSIDLLATLIGWSALWIEYKADNELRAFRLNPANSGQTLATGVWSWCRHPNYLGEIGFWIALFVYCWAAIGSAALSLAVWGPIAMIGLFTLISIPMIDKRLADRDGFEAHKSNTFALLPFSRMIRRNG